MKVSGFTFLRNGVVLGYPFVESIPFVLDHSESSFLVIIPAVLVTRLAQLSLVPKAS
jgi:hypothetical protein